MQTIYGARKKPWSTQSITSSRRRSFGNLIEPPVSPGFSMNISYVLPACLTARGRTFVVKHGALHQWFGQKKACMLPWHNEQAFTPTVSKHLELNVPVGQPSHKMHVFLICGKTRRPACSISRGNIVFPAISERKLPVTQTNRNHYPHRLSCHPDDGNVRDAIWPS